jgi:hypothetical protein
MTNLVQWSDWVPFADALSLAPRLPGVYMAREGETGEVVYIGMAGERNGGGRPQGIRGRLSVYASGKGLASGLGEAVFDRALADPEWLRARLSDLEKSGPRRAKHWGIEAFVRADLRIRWTTTANRASAATLENQLVADAGSTLWNKASVRLGAFPTSATAPRPASSTFERVVQVGNPTTQRITDVDLAAGQIRIPLAHKHLFPLERQQVVIVLRGEAVTCTWKPRIGPDRQRSGLLRPPTDVFRRLVNRGDRLAIGADGAHVSLT